MTSEIERRPAFDAQRQIKRVIIDANLMPGDPLPTEVQLMDRLGISRGSLREALKGLQARGIVDVVHGRGMFVGRLSMDALVDGLTFHTQLGAGDDHRRVASELVDVRDILERTLIEQVAREADAGLVRELGQIVDQMELTGESAPPFEELDRQFHTVLYRSIGNEVVTKLIRAFWEVLDAARPALPTSQDDRAENARHHRAIFEAIRAGEPEMAREAMQQHFSGTHRWIQDSPARRPARLDTEANI
ncbi:MAG: hypothetical protein QOC66_4313 [Pseudonocardiales bacterium]|jgi:DNA-binding FadR family transcriptional regulator|nr:hypothetical protein [Pseudonocardiales bacterium]